jgi:hypothetical protein
LVQIGYQDSQGLRVGVVSMNIGSKLWVASAKSCSNPPNGVAEEDDSINGDFDIIERVGGSVKVLTLGRLKRRWILTGRWPLSVIKALR